MMLDYVGTGLRPYEEGEIADREVRASSSFHFIDEEHSRSLRTQAEDRVEPVFDFDSNLNPQLQFTVREAFLGARNRLDSFEGAEPSPEALNEIDQSFQDALGFTLRSEDRILLSALLWSEEAEELSVQLIESEMGGYIIADKSVIPKGHHAYDVIRIFENERAERRHEDWSIIRSPEEARQHTVLMAQQFAVADSPALTRAATAVAQAAVRVNLSYNLLLTEDRRRDARRSVVDEVIVIKKGTVLLREGDPVTRDKAEKMLSMLSQQEQGFGLLGAMLALVALCGMVVVSLYSFGSGFVRKFSTEPRDLEAMTFLALLTLFLGRVILESSVVFSGAIGMGMGSTALWYATPFACGAMLVRILVNSETAMIWLLGTSALMGLMMEQQALLTVYFIISGVVAAAGMAHTRERVHLLRAGLQTGLINAAVALLIKLAQLYMGNANPLLASSEQPLWDVGFALAGGVGSAVLALGLVPIFELFGFVTDYKMLELANLNHPLLRQLMLKAPGTYHHSMTMALLSEAAAESIGANALQTRIACYYHDIGKSLQPQFFIENQRGGFNPHDRLQPHQSSRIIVTHVIDGAALGEQYNLPQPIMDAIWMHHGTSLVKYFYVRALEQAAPDEVVDEADFRYPGKRPNTREAGIIFLADRVEAACRTLKDPSPQDFRSMIQDLVNSAVAEGQLVECPLTIKEIYTVIDSFTETLVSVYHHRIEYPKMPDLPPPSAIITLEAPNPLRDGDGELGSAEAGE
jgi:cyclic-di-AMP phosphodiesterase PgpH